MSKQVVQNLLKNADIEINGKRPWDIQVKNPRFYDRVLAKGSLGLGEAYVDGWWECKKLDEFFYRVLRADLDKKVKVTHMMAVLQAKLTNMQSISRAFKVGEQHYDIGNDLYEHMLDKRMVYSCAYWKDAGNLDEAQEDKLDLICKKINLKKGMTVLDIGCGWGSFAKFAAEKYGARVLGVTISKEQAELARKRCKNLPVEIRVQDYRSVKEKFDRVVSVGMFEHVGYKNYRTFMNIANRCLKDDGLFLLHTIGTNVSTTHTDAWIEKYIFPNSMLPSAQQIATAAEGLFMLEDWHNFGTDYDKTLLAWYANFVKNKKKIAAAKSERFCRMWEYYLLSCAGSFRALKNRLWQVVFSKNGVEGGYVSVR